MQQRLRNKGTLRTEYWWNFLGDYVDIEDFSGPTAAALLAWVQKKVVENAAPKKSSRSWRISAKDRLPRALQHASHST